MGVQTSPPNSLPDFCRKSTKIHRKLLWVRREGSTRFVVVLLSYIIFRFLLFNAFSAIIVEANYTVQLAQFRMGKPWSAKEWRKWIVPSLCRAIFRDHSNARVREKRLQWKEWQQFVGKLQGRRVLLEIGIAGVQDVLSTRGGGDSPRKGGVKWRFVPPHKSLHLNDRLETIVLHTLGRKHINRNKLAGFSRDWVDGNKLFMCFGGSFLMVRKTQEGCDGLGGENPGVLLKAGVAATSLPRKRPNLCRDSISCCRKIRVRIFQQRRNLPETLPSRNFRHPKPC